MRKQTKIAAVVSAAALLALGASMTSFAASKGTWMMVDGEWYCYDKNGDAYENTFCSSNGKEYYVGDDGQLVRSQWVEDGADKYFVNSSGAKITATRMRFAKVIHLHTGGTDAGNPPGPGAGHPY